MTKLIEAAKTLRDAIKAMDACIKEERKESGVFAWYHSGNNVQFQMELDAFLKEFGERPLIERGCEMYPYQLEADKDEILFFSILDQNEYQEYIKEAQNGSDQIGELSADIA